MSIQGWIHTRPGLSLFNAGASRRLRLVASYFLLVGFIGAVVGPLSLLVGFAAFPAFRSQSQRLLTDVAIPDLIAVGWLFAGILLARQQKRGALLAFIVLLFQVLNHFGGGGGVSLSVMIVGAIGMLALLSILGELR